MDKRNKIFSISEDWWAMIVAFLLILFAVLGVLGEGGLSISF